ncbi:MAG: NirD/YgiW/YdeI family stress tolerance protein [Pusillimonas sp.]
MSPTLTPRYWLAAALMAGAFALPVHAQYTGPSDGTASPTVATILEKPVDDQNVRLQGHLLRKVGHEKYIFSDGTGEIIAEIDDDDFPRQTIDEKTVVELFGEVDTGLRRPPEIEVDTIRVK